MSRLDGVMGHRGLSSGESLGLDSGNKGWDEGMDDFGELDDVMTPGKGEGGKKTKKKKRKHGLKANSAEKNADYAW